MSIEELKLRMQTKADGKVSEILSQRKGGTDLGEKSNTIVVTPDATTLSVVNNAEPAIDSSKDEENEQQIWKGLREQTFLWKQRIQLAKTEEDFRSIQEDAARNGKYRVGFPPGFVVGKPFRDLLKKYPIIPDETKERLRDQAYQLQDEIEVVYLAKQAEIFPPVPATFPDVKTDGSHGIRRRQKRGKNKLVKADRKPKQPRQEKIVYWNLKSAEGVVFPDPFEGDLDLVDLQSVAGLNLPNTISGDLKLYIRSIEGLSLPKNKIQGSLYIDWVPHVRGLKFPLVEKNIYLRGLESAQGLELQKSFKGKVFLTKTIAEEFLRLHPDLKSKVFIYEEGFLDNMQNQEVTLEGSKKTNAKKASQKIDETRATPTTAGAVEPKIEPAVQGVVPEYKNGKWNWTQNLMSQGNGKQEVSEGALQEQKAEPAKEKTEAEQIKRFVNSFAEGEVIILTSKNGKKLQFKRDGDDIIGKNTRTISTESVWKKSLDTENWKVEKAANIPEEEIQKTGAEDAHIHEGQYRSENGVMRTIKKRAKGGFLEIFETGQETTFLTQEKLDEYAEREGWVRVSTGEVFKRKTVVSPEGETASLDKSPEKGNEAGESKSEAGVNESEVAELEQKIVQLKKQVEDLRKEYARLDYEETNAWSRVKNFFGRALKGFDKRARQETEAPENEERRDSDFSKKQYKEKLVELEEAQLALIKKRERGGDKGWKKEMADMVHYFELDEVMNLINARTEYRAEKQDLTEKPHFSFAALESNYSKLSKKEILALTALCAGSTVAFTAVGGVAAGALLYMVIGTKRVAGSTGLTIGLASLLDSSRMNSRNKEITKAAEKHALDVPGKGFDDFEAAMKEKIMAIDEKFQSEKWAKLRQKIGALTVGVIVGSGWLSQIVIDKFGGREAAEWAKEQIGKVPGSVKPPQPKIFIPTEPVEQFSSPQGPLHIPALEAVATPDTISEFIDQEYPVQKGDSIWKIVGRLADNLNLEDAEKTRFINDLKNQIATMSPEDLKALGISSGDINKLALTDTIDFSEAGIDRDFVERALGDAQSLTDAQVESINANDAKIAEFAAKNPTITLTNEKVDQILHGTRTGIDSNTSVASPEDVQTASGDMTDSEATNTGTANQGGMQSADFQYERDIVLGKEYDVKSYTDFFKKSPESFGQFKKIGEAYMNFSFQGNESLMKEIGGKTFAELKTAPNGSLAKFIKIAQETYGTKYGAPNLKEGVYGYFARIAMLGLEHPKGVIRLPQSI